MNFLDNQKVLTVAAEGEVETLDVNNEDRRFWLNVIASHPTYRDAYIELAQIDYEQGRLKEAEAWLNKAYQIDPNSSVVASHFERMFKK